MTQSKSRPTGTWIAVLLVAFLGLVSFLLLLYTDRSWQNNFRKHIPLHDNLMRARTTLALASLWLEKMLDGDDSITPEMVRGLFDRTIEAVEASKQGVSAITGLSGLRVRNEDLLRELDNYKASIQRTRDIAQERWKNRKHKNLQLELTERFGFALQEAGLAGDVIDFMASLYIAKTMDVQQTMQELTHGLWLVFVAGACIILYIVGRKRDRAEEQIRMLSQRLIRAQEQERQRLSHDLHDNLAQDLAHLKIRIDTLAELLPDTDARVQERVAELSGRVEKAIRTVRDLAYGLRPAGLGQLGLARVAAQLCEDMSTETGLEVKFFSAGMEGVKLDLDTGIALYRLIQEALNNTAKHAHARRIRVRLVASFPTIILRIDDDGRGFDAKKHLKQAVHLKKMGIRSMEERVALLQGRMKITSAPGRGTKIMVEIPYKEAEIGTEADSDC